MADRSIKGELNFNTVAKLYREDQWLIGSKDWKGGGSLPHHSLEFDLAEVTSCDSAGLVLLLSWMRDAKRDNKVLHFINIPHKLLDIASISGLKEKIKG